jgi:hypothetical protein
MTTFGAKELQRLSLSVAVPCLLRALLASFHEAYLQDLSPVLQGYNEMIQGTAHMLELHVRQIDEKTTRLNIQNTSTSGVSIDPEDEREVTKQYLCICEDTRSYIESLSERESSLLPETSQNAVEENSFEAQLRMRQALDEIRDSFAQTIGYLGKRLDRLI